MVAVDLSRSMINEYFQHYLVLSLEQILLNFENWSFGKQSSSKLVLKPTKNCKQNGYFNIPLEYFKYISYILLEVCPIYSHSNYLARRRQWVDRLGQEFKLTGGWRMIGNNSSMSVVQYRRRECNSSMKTNRNWFLKRFTCFK